MLGHGDITPNVNISVMFNTPTALPHAVASVIDPSVKVQWNLYNETEEVLLKSKNTQIHLHKFHHLSGIVFSKSFFILHERLQRPQNLVVAIYIYV